MSTIKEDYLTEKITAGCPPEHVDVAEGDDNSTGKVIDSHKLAEKEPEWDAIRNSDIQVLSQRLISHEKKTGELGWDPSASTYTPVPKSGSTPAYTDPYGPSNLVVGKGDQDVAYPIGETKPFIQDGDTHNQAILKHEKAIHEAAVRAGIPTPNPQDPALAGDNFQGTFKYGTSEDFDTVEDHDFTFPDGPSTVPTYSTLQNNKSFPFYYEGDDAITEAVAKLDYNLYKEINDLRSELRVVKHFLGQAFNDINKIKSALLDGASTIINPEFDIDDNGLVLGDGGKYVTSVQYDVTIKSGNTSGTPFTVTSGTTSTVDGVSVMAGNPYSLIMRVADVPAPYNPGNPDSLDVTVTATDSEGNFAVSTMSNVPF